MRRNILSALIILILMVSCSPILNPAIQTATPWNASAVPTSTENVTSLSITAPTVAALSNSPIKPGSTIPQTVRFGKTYWNPGLPNGIPNVPVAANVRDFGATGDGRTDDSRAFNNAIRSVSVGAVLIPAGTYLLNAPLVIGTSIVLRGEGANNTHLIFDLAGQNKDAITIAKYERGPWVKIIGSYTGGSTTLALADASSFRSGMFVEIQQANDPLVMYTDPTWKQNWSENAVGQIVRVISVSGNTIKLEEPLRNNYKTSLNPQIRTLGLVEYAGIERLHINRLDKDDNHIIFFKHVAFGWLREIESENAFRSHILIDSSYGCEIRDSYFHDAHDYGAGGHGYGVNLFRHTTNCLIENNIFVHLRHAMIIGVGTVGNVFGYNYSREPVSNENPLPDISIHGHYSSYNLFEGNIVQEIGISDYWGPIGPGNVYFRNRVETKDIFVRDSSHSQTIVGNELVRGTINIDESVNDTRVNGNYINGNMVLNGQIVWNLTDLAKILPASKYYLSKPPFYGSLQWPSLGADLPGGTNPALERYKSEIYIPPP